MCCKCGAERLIQAGAAGVDLCPKYTHASRGQECGAPKLIGRISGVYVLFTRHGGLETRASVRLTAVFLSQSGGTQAEKGGTRSSTNKPTNTARCPPKLTNTDRQLTHSSTQRAMSGLRLWQEAAHPPVHARGLLVMFFISVSAAMGQIPQAVWR